VDPDGRDTMPYTYMGKVLTRQHIRPVVFPASAGVGHRVTNLKVTAGFLHSYAITCAPASDLDTVTRA
jgi:hypothetical protein